MELQWMNYPVPDCVRRLVEEGQFFRALEKIEEQQKGVATQGAFQRLAFERTRILDLKRTYPWCRSEAKQHLQEQLPDVSEEEWNRFQEEQWLDCIPVEGETRFERRFVENLFFLHPELAPRRKNGNALREKTDGLLHPMIDQLIQGKGAERSYRVEAQIRLSFRPTHPYRGKKTRCWLPFPREDLQQSGGVLLEADPVPTMVSPACWGQRTVFFERDGVKDQEFTLRFGYSIRPICSAVDPQQVQRLSKADRSRLRPFLQPEAPHVCFTPLLRELAENLSANQQNPYFVAQNIYSWITQNVRYRYMLPYRLYSCLAEYAVVNRLGDCGVQAFAFITLCRLAGIPARWQSGWYANPGGVGNHDWALFYVAPYGWLPVDCSFGGARRERPAYRSFFFTNLDPFRMVSTSSPSCPFRPATDFFRADPFDNQSGELQTDQQTVDPAEYHSTAEILSFSEE
ncbi:MAG TPA: transglutaminase-like domain-containing protein [Thermotogota bacterium]|nr:transglutaminase-like domain-containing protein [Thermotogota bacterium]HRW91644.1 transglutaminase-like domain-containing protein [Thermotogota bacterium]